MKKQSSTRSMMTSLLVTAAIAIGAFALPLSAAAINVFPGSCPGGSVCDSSGDSVGGLFQNIVSLLLYAIGAVSVIMIVIGGFKYTTSNGDANNMQSAKNTILYSVIGLLVAIMGQAIVLFVTNWFA